jgi:hypothetical protein
MLRTLLAIAGVSVGIFIAAGCTIPAEEEAIGNWSPHAFDQGRVKDVLVVVRDKSGLHANDGLCDRVERRFVEALTEKGYGVVSQEAPDAFGGEADARRRLTSDEGVVKLARMANASAVLVVAINGRDDSATNHRSGRTSPADGWVSARMLLPTMDQVWSFSGVRPEPGTADTRAVIERAAVVVAANLPNRNELSAAFPTP